MTCAIESNAISRLRTAVCVSYAIVVIAVAPARAQSPLKGPILPVVPEAPRIQSAHIALRVFDPREGGPNVGVQFVRMPDGVTFMRGEGRQGNAAGEIFKLAIQLQVAARQRWIAEMRERKLKGKPARIIETAPKPLSAFFTDDTLNPGDVVVAREGFRVFRGSKNFPWRAADFVTLERWQSRRSERRGLTAMEREYRRRGDSR